MESVSFMFCALSEVGLDKTGTDSWRPVRAAPGPDTPSAELVFETGGHRHAGAVLRGDRRPRTR
ncbi:hypothetical protein [Streptosporangium brasiliense]|uniref:Uncharacterized protein n=2 Tax=Streptosporangium TaxID=2000 RepID=A0ABT9R1L6_9ACTN|nr:hypothetical protein [Streptosporangium brasiliense]MDP9862699.1 hypothetical protein [Streptosporangium brasiliense]